MAVSYPVPTTTITPEQTLKQSRFICHLGHGLSAPQVLTELDRLRAAHPKAAHLCWAYIAGPPTTTEKGMSADGEPRGTAGRPMLTLLEHSGYGENWAMTMARFYKGPTTALFLLGGGLCVQAAWCFGTLLGHRLGAVITNPELYGLDFSFVAVFTALVFSFWKGRQDVLPWLQL